MDPQLEKTVTELTAKLKCLEESWREEREKLLEENKRLEAVGQQRWGMGRGTGGWCHEFVLELTSSTCKLPICYRSQELQMALHQVHQLERELDVVKKDLAGSQNQLQVRCSVNIPSYCTCTYICICTHMHTHAHAHTHAHTHAYTLCSVGPPLCLSLCVFCVRLC